MNRILFKNVLTTTYKANPCMLVRDNTKEDWTLPKYRFQIHRCNFLRSHFLLLLLPEEMKAELFSWRDPSISQTKVLQKEIHPPALPIH